jgi:hypothetical protein
MLEFHERITSASQSYPTGQFRSVLKSDELKATGSTCVVFETEKAWNGTTRFMRKTCNGSPGSTRYASYPTLEQAYAESRKWAKRKIAAHQRDMRERAIMSLCRVARFLATGDQFGRTR